MKEKTGSPVENGLPPLTEKVDQSTMAPPPPSAENLVMRDGIRVHPQPTSDPLDPLNWSSFQKHSILAVIMLKFVYKLHAFILSFLISNHVTGISCSHI